MSIRKNRPRSDAFTLVEIMFVLALFLLITIGLTAFTRDAVYGMNWAVSKSRITTDVRIFTTRIANEAFDANGIYIYPSFAVVDRNTLGDRRSGSETGDCMVLVEHAPYADVKDDAGVASGTDADRYYTGIIVYYRRPDADGEGPVYRVAQQFNPAIKIVPGGNNNHFEDFLATHFPSGSPSGEETVLELARGLADKSLFRTSDVLDGFIVINGEILHGVKDVAEITNTYNLTIAPKG